MNAGHRTLTLVICALGLLGAAPSWGWTLVAPDLRGWSSPQLTVQFDFAECPGDESVWISVLDRALGVWNSAALSGVTLNRAPDSISLSAAGYKAAPLVDPFVVCNADFTAEQQMDGDFIPAVTELGVSDGRIVAGIVVLNSEDAKESTMQNLSRDQRALVLAHELGHVLGLGHSSNAQALMYYNLGEKHALVLAQDDMDSLAFLYPRNEFVLGPFGCASTRRPVSPIGLLAVVAWLLGLWVFIRPARLL